MFQYTSDGDEIGDGCDCGYIYTHSACFSTPLTGTARVDGCDGEPGSCWPSVGRSPPPVATRRDEICVCVVDFKREVSLTLTDAAVLDRGGNGSNVSS